MKFETEFYIAMRTKWQRCFRSTQACQHGKIAERCRVEFG